MNKTEFKELKKYRNLERLVINEGYTESKKNGSSHRIYKAQNKPTLSIPNGELSDGVLRNILKLVLGQAYYS
jgi:predicted RNA binding protein YcfA (HicA-like mRNA interferase family)